MNFMLLLGIVVGALLIPLLALLFRAFTLEVEDEEVALVTRFGKLVQTVREPGLYFLPGRLFPWVRILHVSTKHDFRLIRDVHVNDARGTTVMVDLWVEFRVVDPAKAMFSVADWDRSLQNLVSHAATSILGNRDFRQILCDRMELGQRLQRDISEETARWGLSIDLVFIHKVSLLPEISRHIFETIAARLVRAKADIEELGRLAVAQLEAETSVKVSSLVAEAKAQYPLAIGRAFSRLKASPRSFLAYEELYRLSLLRPHRTVAFRGFDAGELRAIDAAMLPSNTSDSGPHSTNGKEQVYEARLY